MYGIYANIGGILMVNVTIYSIHGSYGQGGWYVWEVIQQTHRLTGHVKHVFSHRHCCGPLMAQQRAQSCWWNKQLASHFGIRGACIICRAMFAIFSAGQYSDSLTFADSHQLWTISIKVSYYLSAIYSVHLRNTYFVGKNNSGCLKIRP